jgi:hypothetical protein
VGGLIAESLDPTGTSFPPGTTVCDQVEIISLDPDAAPTRIAGDPACVRSNRDAIADRVGPRLNEIRAGKQERLADRMRRRVR